MSTLLVSTIVRNEARFLDRYHAQLRDLAAAQAAKDHTLLLSIYENDSTDGSGTKLAALDWSFLPAFHLTTACMQTPHFVGGKHPLRVQLLADARNRSIFHCGFLPVADRVIVIEPDVAYTPAVADAIVNEGMAWDVFSGKSVHPGTQSIYDSWGTRKTAQCTDWADGDQVQDGGLEEIWSTYHCFVNLSAEAFRKGARFSGTNPRTGLVGECDTVAVVESFRQLGFNRVAWRRDLFVEHDCT